MGNWPRCSAWVSVFLCSAIVSVGCRDWDPRYAYVTERGSSTKLIADSPEVRRRLAQAPSRDVEREQIQKGRAWDEQLQLMEEIRQHPSQYLGARSDLLEWIGRQPGVVVEGEQYFRMLEQSSAGCDLLPIPSAMFIRVRVTTGPLAGREGWACNLDVKPTGALVM